MSSKHQRTTAPEVYTYSKADDQLWLLRWRAAGFDPKRLEHEATAKIKWFDLIDHLTRCHPFETDLPRWHAISRRARPDMFTLFVAPNIVPAPGFRIDMRHLRDASADRMVLLHGLDAVMASQTAYLRWLNLIAATHVDKVADIPLSQLSAAIAISTRKQFPDFFSDEPAQVEDTTEVPS